MLVYQRVSEAWPRFKNFSKPFTFPHTSIQRYYLPEIWNGKAFLAIFERYIQNSKLPEIFKTSKFCKNTKTPLRKIHPLCHFFLPIRTQVDFPSWWSCRSKGAGKHCRWKGIRQSGVKFTPLKLTVRPWKLMVGRLLSFWGTSFRVLCYIVSGRVS